MKQAGIWMDSKKAHIIKLVENGETLETITSDIEFFNRTGTDGPRVKWGGTQDITHEKSYLEKEKKQFKAYFKSIAEAVSNVDSLALFGPAAINQKFKKELSEHYKFLAEKLIVVEKADSMTINQTKALVRDFFGQN